VSDKHELEAIKVALEGYMEELYRRAITVAEDYYGPESVFSHPKPNTTR
jgi:hypothetical protein